MRIFNNLVVAEVSADALRNIQSTVIKHIIMFGHYCFVSTWNSTNYIAKCRVSLKMTMSIQQLDFCICTSFCLSRLSKGRKYYFFKNIANVYDFFIIIIIIMFTSSSVINSFACHLRVFH